MLLNIVYSLAILATSVISLTTNSYIIRARRNINTKLSVINVVDGEPPRLYSEEWARERGMVPGYGGIWPGNPDAKKYKVTLKSSKTREEYTTYVPEDRYIFFYFEEMGIDLPVVNKLRMCRQGCCTICTAKISEGKVKMDAPLGLLKEFRQDGYALTCVSMPKSDIVAELQDEDETYIKQWSEGFEGGGIEWGGVLPDDD